MEERTDVGLTEKNSVGTTWEVVRCLEGMGAQTGDAD